MDRLRLRRIDACKRGDRRQIAAELEVSVLRQILSGEAVDRDDSADNRDRERACIDHEEAFLSALGYLRVAWGADDIRRGDRRREALRRSSAARRQARAPTGSPAGQGRQPAARPQWRLSHARRARRWPRPPARRPPRRSASISRDSYLSP